MLIVIANSLPDAVRGRMKLWFIEPKPNVFVSGVNDAVGKKVIEFLTMNCPDESGLMIFTSKSISPGFDIHTLGDTTKKLTKISGLQLVIQKNNSQLDNS